MNGSPSIPAWSQISVNGITPAAFNIGNTANTGAGSITATTANTVSYQITNNPGSYSGGGTVTLLYQYVLSSLIQWGGGFDANVMPDHLEIVQCAFRGDGDGDVTHGVIVSGDNVKIVDSYFTGLQSPGTDAGPLLALHGAGLEIRNNYIGGGDENFGVGGSHVAAGTIPRFQYFVGNEIVKEPWIGMLTGSGAPGSAALLAGEMVSQQHHQLGDYICSSTSGGLAG